MELNKDLQSLLERAWALHDKINDEIKNSISFCWLCSENVRYCDIAETPVEERERLIAIGDSLKEVQNRLMFLQRLRSWQLIDKHAAVTRLEESRLILIEKVTQYRGRALDVVKELNAHFGNGETAFNWCVRDDTKKKKKETDPTVQEEKRRITSVFVCCIRYLFNPWKWQKAIGIAVKLLVVSVGTSSTIHFYQTRQLYSSSRRKTLSEADSTEAGVEDSPLTISKSSLNVFRGRG